MNSPTNFQPSSFASCDFLQALGAELIFTQDVSGQYLSFYWKEGVRFNLSQETLVGCRMHETFGPIPITPYLNRVARVLDYLMPERFSYPFYYQDQFFPFDLIVSPVLVSNEKATKVLVMGRLLPDKINTREVSSEEWVTYPSLLFNLDLHQKMISQIAGRVRRTLPPSSELYHKLLSQISWKIRRTLDLKEIWQQTVNGLGQVLDVSRCILCPYQEPPLSPIAYPQNENLRAQLVKVVAEYCQDPFDSMLGLELTISSQPGWTQALTQYQPILVTSEELVNDLYERRSLLVIATRYQDQPNGLISLEQCNESRRWTPLEIEFVQELTDQVGTAIAHATLYHALEEAREAAEAISQHKSQFLANTSHELRTPLNGIIGFIKLLIDGMADDAEEAQQFLQEAYHSSLHLLNLINDILDIAKIEAGKMQVDLEPVNLNSVFDTVVEFTRAQIQQKQLTLKIQKLSTDEAILVYANQQRLLQVLLNLVGNSTKFTHEGGIYISMDIIPGNVIVKNQQCPGFLEIRVADTGIGVSLEKQGKLFQSFFQVETGNTRLYGGTGLGLAISQKLVLAMGGTMSFYSLGEGLGSTVTFTVPLYQIQAGN